MKYIDKTTKSGKVVKLKNYKKRVKINKIKRKILLFLFIIICILSILLFAPFMKIKKINCVGNTVNNSNDIISVSGISIGDNLIRINKIKAKKDITEKFPYIKNIDIKRKLFSTVNITVTEENISSYFNVKNEYYYINSTGKVIDKSDSPPTYPVPVLSGVKPVKYEINSVVEFKNKEQLKKLNELLKVTEKSKFKDKITIINLTDLNNISFTVNNSIDIIVGTTDNLEYKINFLAIGTYDNVGEGVNGTINVSYGKKAVYKQN